MTTVQWIQKGWHFMQWWTHVCYDNYRIWHHGDLTICNYLHSDSLHFSLGFTIMLCWFHNLVIYLCWINGYYDACNGMWNVTGSRGLITQLNLFQMQEMDTLRIAEELKKQSLADHNRFSKDSGVVDIESLKPSTSASSRLSAPDYHQRKDSSELSARCKQPQSASLTEIDQGASTVLFLLFQAIYHTANDSVRGDKCYMSLVQSKCASSCLR